MIGCCWPPSETPPAEPFTVDAGAPQTVEEGDSITLAGSSANGAPPVTYLWTVVSGPGVATFVDDTDPTTDVSFDTAGTYVLQLTGTDDDGSVAGDTVTETVTSPGEFLLDQLEAQPLFAFHIGVQLRTGQTNVFRCRRSSDDAEQDFTVADLVDIEAALNAFCGSGLGYLVGVYNAVSNAYVSLLAGDAGSPSNASQAVIYSADDGGAIFGATGFLAARFDGTTGGGGDDVYTRADTLGLVGDVALTLAGDVSVDDTIDTFWSGMGIGNDHGGDLSFYFEIDGQSTDGGGDNYLESYFLGGITAAGVADAITPPARNYYQTSRAAGSNSNTIEVRINGVVQALPPDPASNAGPFPINVGGRVGWGSYTGKVGGGSTPGIMSNGFVWNAVLGGADQATLDAWQVAHSA